MSINHIMCYIGFLLCATSCRESPLAQHDLCSQFSEALYRSGYSNSNRYVVTSVVHELKPTESSMMFDSIICNVSNAGSVEENHTDSIIVFVGLESQILSDGQSSVSFVQYVFRDMQNPAPPFGQRLPPSIAPKGDTSFRSGRPKYVAWNRSNGTVIYAGEVDFTF